MQNAFQNFSESNQTSIGQLLSRVKDVESLTERAASAEKVPMILLIFCLRIYSKYYNCIPFVLGRNVGSGARRAAHAN